jgi:ankyrin repeat protein
MRIPSISKVKLLLEYKANPKVMGDRNDIFRGIDSMKPKSMEIYDLLIQHGLSLDDDDMTLVRRAVSDGNLTFLKYLHNKKVPVDGKPLKRPYSPLHIALSSYEDCGIMVPALMDYGYNPVEVYTSGTTPLHLAVNSCNADIVRLLISKGLDPKKKNESGYTPLDYAKDKPDILNALKGKK